MLIVADSRGRRCGARLQLLQATIEVRRWHIIHVSRKRNVHVTSRVAYSHAEVRRQLEMAQSSSRSCEAPCHDRSSCADKGASALRPLLPRNALAHWRFLSPLHMW